MKQYRFFLHYNKPLSKKFNKHMWSVHYKNKCYFSENIQCNVITESKVNKEQPYVVMRGFAKNIEFNNDTIIIS